MALLDRLRKKTSTPETNVDQTRSVVEHLRKLLNSRQGSTLMDPEYGMPDFMDMRANYPDSVNEIQQSIEKTIRCYEPRVKDAVVTFVNQDEQDLTLYFQIRAELKSDRDVYPVYLESALDASGKMAVKGGG